MDNFLIGAIAMASWIVGLFFLRFWRDTRDRLFLIFAVAFWLLGLTRLALVVLRSEEHHYIYWFRLAAFVLMVAAIVDKNRPRRAAGSEKLAETP
ncbi:MAG TPA: DUF5985 family protein [Planctomycetaceae bacterium]|nr:DUF5985 family protein [Planctomycetaceae bacterium]